MNTYTDLAKEIKEGIPGEIDGVLYHENEDSGVTLTRIEVINKNGEEVTGKPCGKYITVEIQKSPAFAPATSKKAREILAGELTGMIGEFNTALVIGLGNRRITPDSLGSRVVDRLLVTRHMLYWLSLRRRNSNTIMGALSVFLKSQ